MKLAVFVLLLLAKHSFADSYNETITKNQELISTKQDEHPEVSEKVVFLLATNQTYLEFEQLKELPKLAFSESFNRNLPTAIYIHGWQDNGKFDTSCSAIRDAYLERGGYNFITIDWSAYSKNYYYHLTVVPQLKVIAEIIAERLLRLDENGYSINNIHLVGHSLGGQMAGKIGRELKELSKGALVIPQIYALDPAGPGFENHWIDGFEGITRNDAAYVQVIHTDSGRLGFQNRVGTIDFYPNGGSRHPGCGVETFSPELLYDSMRCYHARAWHFYQQSVRDPTSMPAVRCDSWDDFLENKSCYRDDIEYMGFGADLRTTGKYFLETRANIFNLSKGMEGTVYSPPKVTRMMPPNSRDTSIPAEIQENDYF